MSHDKNPLHATSPDLRMPPQREVSDEVDKLLTANGQNQVESLNNLVQLIDINSKNSSENDEFENIENENIEPWSFEKSEYGHNDPGHNYGQNDPVNSDFGHNDAGYNDAVHSNTANNEVLKPDSDTDISESPQYTSYVTTGNATNVYAKPYSPSPNLVEALEKGTTSVYSDEQRPWKHKECVYSTNSIPASISYTNILPYNATVDLISEQQQQSLPSSSHEPSKYPLQPNFDHKKNKYYYPKYQHNFIYDNPSKFIQGGNHSMRNFYPMKPEYFSRNYPTLAHKGSRYASQFTKNTAYDMLFMSETLKSQLEAETIDTYRVVPAEDGFNQAEPSPYYGLYPLSSEWNNSRCFFGYPNVVYKAFSSKNNLVYALRRIKGFNIYQEESFSSINRWVSLVHPNIVSLKEALTTKAFGDDSLVFVYEYHPLAVTLEKKRKHYESLSNTANISEDFLWSCIIQLVCALKAVHSAKLSLKILDEHNVIVTEDDRVRINSCGIVDTMAKEPYTNLDSEQDNDLYCLGRLIIYLITGKKLTPHNLTNTLNDISRLYTHKLMSLIVYLVSSTPQNKDITEVSVIISSTLLDGFQNVYSYVDLIKSNLKKEMHNGRLVRLLCKLGFINERPEFAMDPNWSETGDRYLIKLFRDYLFHQIDDNMQPVIDIGHVIHCLNKLDCGIDEKIMLISRDENSSLIVSYKELKKCIKKSFDQLLGD